MAVCLSYNSIDDIISFLGEHDFLDVYEKKVRKPTKKQLRQSGLLSSQDISILKNYGLNYADCARVQTICVSNKLTFTDYRNRVFGLQLELI